jgi:hypothetical protein
MVGCNSKLVATHFFAGTVTLDGICEEHSVTGLEPCGKKRYYCAIADGPNPPTEDAFIEWYWAVQYIDVSTITHYITGKFTFCANATFILNTWNANGGTYVTRTNGIPMFNQSNHNV